MTVEKILYKEAKEVLGNAMDYTRNLVANVRDDIRCIDEGHDELERRLNIIANKVDKIERILDEYHIGRAQDILNEDPYCHNNADEVQAKFSKAFMKGILDQCDIDDCDGVEIVIYKHGKRVRSYEYDKKT